MDSHISNLIDLIPKDGSVFDIQKLFFLLTMDSATHFLFGETVGCMNAGGVPEDSKAKTAQGFAEAFNIAQGYLMSRSKAQTFYWMVNPKEVFQLAIHSTKL